MKYRMALNKKRAIDKLVCRLRQKFSRNNKLPIFIVGDCSEGCSLRGTETSLGIGLKRALAKHFKVYYLDEYNTSALHWKTHEKNSKAIRISSDKTEKERPVL